MTVLEDGPEQRWAWSQPDPNQEGAAGNLANLFKNQPQKTPGVIESVAADHRASLLAREAVQNSWDSAIEQAELLGRLPEMTLRFEFYELTGAAKADFVSSLGIDEMYGRAMSAEGWKKVGFARGETVQALGNPDQPLRILRVVESGTTGMYGPWDGARSRMYFALFTIGWTLKPSGSGGSYGYGKAGLLSASGSRTVVAYSCFDEREDDPGVTRRLMGVNYWNPHHVDDQSFTGWGRFGVRRPGGVGPFENETADDVATSLGFQSRPNPSQGHRGTSFLILDPVVTPDEVLRALEVNWWPAIVDDDGFEMVVVDYDGEERSPRPKTHPELRAFIRSYEIAQTGGHYDTETERKKTFDPLELPSHGRKQVHLGAIGLVAEPDDWSWASDDDLDHRSLVALQRGPRMNVEYFVTGTRPPYIRGAFIAHHDVDDLLRQTEPPLHNAWQTDGLEEGLDRDAPLVASTVLKRIRTQVDQFRKALRPPTPERGRFRLKELEKLWDQLFHGGAGQPPPPPGPPREITINIIKKDLEPVEGDSERIRLAASVEFSLTDNTMTNAPVEVMIHLDYRFMEDDRVGSAADSHCPLEIDPPDGFLVGDDNTYVGRINPGSSKLFKLRSAPFDQDYAGRLIVNAERTHNHLETSDG